ncbi:MAG TPA: glycosyl hydrolase [Verrucomicrobiae bacterium]
MKTNLFTALFLGAVLASGFSAAAGTLETGWQNPPHDARLRAYWWWLNGNVTKASITHDLEQMKAKGFGGAVLVDANGAAQDGNGTVPHGPTFFSPEWRALYKYALREADRLGLEISLNIQSGWNLGGPVVTKEDAAKKYVWSELKIFGGTNLEVKLPLPKSRENFYRDTAIVAYRVKNFAPPAPLKNWKQKALQESLEPFSTPDSSPLFAEIPATPGEQDAAATDVLDLTAKLGADEILKWDAPAGDWQIFRFGYTIGDHAYVSTSSDGWGGFALDVYSATAFQNYWNKIVEPLIADAGPFAGKSLKYLHTDSWEIELANWTPTFRAEFQKRHGYDLLPWLPVLAGRIVNSRAESDRFLFDYRQTLGDLAIDNHYKLFRDNAHKHGLGIHPESGGPHAVPIDAQRCLGMDDAPMSEFWAWSWTHRIGDANRFFVKQPASAAHTYGHKFVFAEGFTTIGPNWQEKIWDNLKPSFDKALCEGLNVLVWHAFVCSPDETGIPGQQYFAGTHLNPKVTWWEKSAPFFSYIDRCQFLLQQGNFAADVLYYYGDHVPNFTQYKATDPAHCEPGYDYDVITAEALINRATVKAGKIFLPDGVNYRVLVLPDRDVISLPVLEKIKELVNAGATVIGPKPTHGETLENFASTDAELKKIADELWGGNTGKGHVIAGKTAREVLLADGVKPDCEFINASGLPLDYIHRTSGDAEIYFVANRTNFAATANVAFRVSGKAPELWNAVTGERKFATAYEEKGGQTFVPLDFAPCGSWFVVFREPASAHPAIAKSNGEIFSKLSEISGAWTVHFDPKWGGPETVQFASLVSWPTRPEPGIKFYSGTAVYEKTFDVSDSKLKIKNSKLFLDLGDVHEIAEVKVNGKSCGTVWSPPWRVEVTDAVKAGENKLQIEVVNFWPNRIIGDASLPKEQRLTQTNIRKLTAQTPLETAGLLGPVQLLEAIEPK